MMKWHEKGHDSEMEASLRKGQFLQKSSSFYIGSMCYTFKQPMSHCTYYFLPKRMLVAKFSIKAE